MGVEFQIVNINWDTKVESMGTLLPEINSKKLGRSRKTKKLVIPIFNQVPFWYPMGEEGFAIKMTGKIVGSDNYDEWEPVSTGTLLYVSSSTLRELPAGSYWWVDSFTTERSAGYRDVHWDYELLAEKSQRNVAGDVRT